MNASFAACFDEPSGPIISISQYTNRSTSRAAYRLPQITNPMSIPLQNPIIRIIKSPE